MPNILVFDDTTAKPKDLLSELSLDSAVNYTYSSRIEELDSLIENTSYDLLLLVVNEGPSRSLVNLISKSKNVSHFRGARLAVFHTIPSEEGFRNSLLLGATEVFAEPIKKRHLVQTLKMISETGEPNTFGISYLKRINPLIAEMRVFGRIGKISKDPLGDLAIESNVDLLEDEQVKINCQLSADLHQDYLNYRVLKNESRDIYYNYQRKYLLKWQTDDGLKQKLEAWASRKKNEFVVPKTKLLWVSTKTFPELEPFIEKKIFSLYCKSPDRITSEVLERISPRIVVVENTSTSCNALLQKWKNQERGNVKIFTTRADEKNWELLQGKSPTELHQKLVESVSDFLKERVKRSLEKSIYLSRNSEYSRVYFAAQIDIVSASEKFIKFASPWGLTKNTIVEISSREISHSQEFGLYAKVMKIDELENRKMITCQLVPVSDNPHLLPSPILRSLTYNENRSTRDDSRDSDASSSNIWKVLFFGLVLVLFSIGVFTFSPPMKVSSVEPTSLEKAMEAIRKAFD